MRDSHTNEDDSDLLDIARAVSDGTQVDWDTLESSAPERQKPLIHQLRVISKVSSTHLGGQPLEETAEGESRSPAFDSLPHRWGPLDILESIGTGAFGEVFRAKDSQLEREVALKLFLPESTGHSRQTSDLIAEGRFLARVHHPNVVTIFGAEQHAGLVGIWMEYIKGSTLEEFLEEQGPLGPEDAMLIGRDVCRALATLHNAGIIHRDIKTKNVMRAEGGRIVLMDLGIGCDADSHIPVKQYGTPLYAAPEALIRKESTHQSDIYSTGVLLFHLVTGDYPVLGSTPSDLCKAHKNYHVRKLRDFRPDLSDTFIRIVERALAPDPADRFTTAEEFEQALSIALGDALEPGAMPTREILKRKRCKRILWGVGAVLALAAVLLVGYQILWPNLGRDREVPSDIQRVLATYLENRTGDESLDPIGPMTANWISQGLAHAGLVNVIPTMTVLQAMGAVNAVDTELTDMERLKVLAEASGATIILSGAYSLVSDSLRFHLRATDMQTEELLFSLAPVSGPSERPMETIDQVRENVMDAMVTHLSLAPSVDMIGRPDLLHKPPSFLAYRECIAGIANFGQDYDQSLYHFERAFELDSTFVMPLLWIAWAYTNLGQFAKVDSIVQQLDHKRDLLAPFERHYLDATIAILRGPRGEELRYWKMAEKYTPKDLTINYVVGLNELNMNNPRGTIETYAKIKPPTWFLGDYGGNLRFWVLARAYHHMGDYEQELAIANHALEYHPTATKFCMFKAQALAALGRIQEIHAVIDESSTMSVGLWNPSDVMCAAAKELRVQGQFDTARDLANQAVTWCNQQSDPRKFRWELAHALRLAERWDEAQAEFTELAANNPASVGYMGKLGTLAVRLGDESKAREIFDSLRYLDRPYLMGQHTYWCACISALLGEREKAVALLKEAWEQLLVNPDIKWRDMDLEPLRDYPPFQEMIKPKG